MSAPRLSEELLADYGWELSQTETENALTLPFFSITAHNAIYEHSDSIVAYDDIADPRVTIGGRAFFTTDLQFKPPLSKFGVDPASVFGIATRHAKKEFKKSVEADGLTEVRKIDAREFDRPGGGPARAFGYEVKFPLHDDVIEQDVVDGQFVLESELWAGLWPTEGAYAMAGGMYPLEEVDEAILRQASGARLATDARVHPSPERDREQVFEAMRLVE
ncbi:hypothetical protein [Haloarchaeobius sp. HME9146]|uniref:hypothetical protein n=1 Tax=Haloarchaeobius sp. HME9146 TaxID=2978732 RepID=UPI0021C0AC7B|nr:hypothetical protein [Haloarchaeobius sp. HME9146]MCT9097672.1 hypothetical protein [Haloarchaeobius sp. HME9146]